jgi:phenylpropionate dioxygenase-like ring-hydroxylating dioxygenase large terminal subunit
MLSLGRLDADGKCVHIPYMPEGSEVPSVAKTRSYPVRERFGYIFIW